MTAPDRDLAELQADFLDGLARRLDITAGLDEIFDAAPRPDTSEPA